MYLETWHKTKCDKCETVNWFCDGDGNNAAIAIMDTEAIKCRNCGNIYGFLEDPIAALGDLDETQWITVDGKEKPE